MERGQIVKSFEVLNAVAIDPCRKRWFGALMHSKL